MTADAIAQVLGAAEFPKAMIALTYLIFANMDSISKPQIKRHDSFDLGAGVNESQQGPLVQYRPELLVIACLHTAFSYFTDGPTKLSFWANSIGQGDFTVKQVEAARIFVLAQIKWRVYPLAQSHQLDYVMDLFQGNSPPIEKPKAPSTPQMKLDGSATWQHGLLTPACSPIRASGPDYGMVAHAI